VSLTGQFSMSRHTEDGVCEPDDHRVEEISFSYSEIEAVSSVVHASDFWLF